MATMPAESRNSSSASTRTRSLVLASQSPRRADFLREAGYVFVIAASHFVDDPTPPQDREPLMLAIELASQKARHVKLEALPASHADANTLLVLGADTIAVGDDNVLLGQPQSQAEAGAMIRKFMHRTHRVVTGVCLWQPGENQEEIFADVAEVKLGEVTEAQLQNYLATDAWRGKAGGYNLAHVREIGWPVEVYGDESTVMGLPMQRLVQRLAAWGVHST